MTHFQTQVLQRVRTIPSGRVVSYGQIAASIGTPRAARQVGWIMRSLGKTSDMPWWRVINNQGKISIKGNIEHDARSQKKLLEAEGVVVADDFTLDIEKYRYQFEEKES
ncbi:MAG: MGMT family protein [Patescibacteria group bacterium]